MDLKICSFITLLLLITTIGVQAQNNVFPKLRANFENGQIFVADFEHTYFDSYTDESLASDGKIWVSSDKYRLDSENQLLIVDGVTSRVYDEVRNRVIISDYSEEDDDFAPSRMLNGVDSTYTISEKKMDNGRTKITMTTEDDFALYLTVEIIVDSEANPISITAYDFSDNQIVTTFKNGAFLPKNEELFVLRYPQDAEIVDTRY
ncbi:MAG: outer membrane lipoprotein carrier protein LolA [Balneola sp.]